MRFILFKVRVGQTVDRGIPNDRRSFSSLNLAGAISPSYLLEELEAQISRTKEEAFSRKEILEKVQKWLAACEEECWLEEYNRVSDNVAFMSLVFVSFINLPFLSLPVRF